MILLTEILTNILSPKFLLSNIVIIGQIISVMILVIFDEPITGRLIFPYVDKLRDSILEKSKEKIKKKIYRKLIESTAKILTAVLFIVYFFAGYWILSEYVIIPILQRLKKILLIIVLCFLALMTWLLNNRKVRKKYLYY